MIVCKYCKKKGHKIDNCPDIICKNCKNRGHPFWKCNLIKKLVVENENNNENDNNWIVIENTKRRVTTNNKLDAIKNRDNVLEFKKFIGKNWSELI